MQQEQQQQFQHDPSFHIPPLEEWRRDPFLMSCCQTDSPRPLRVAVLVSGGVDSSLALQLVTAAGHTPTAFYLQIWFQEDFRNFWDACPWEEDLSYAQQVCQSLGVPLVTVPLTQQYWDRVVSHSVAEIKAGRTPNPDILCNSRVKFGAFVEYLEREHAGSFDRIASGHYAMVKQQPAAPAAAAAAAVPAAAGAAAAVTAAAPAAAAAGAAAHVPVEHNGSISGSDSCNNNGSSSSGSSSSHPADGCIDSSSDGVLLCCCPDAVKDQTYFLASLSQSQLSRCMFPLGCFTKPQVRALAAAAGLATSGRKDSQGICFLGKVKFGEFVKEHLGEWPGLLVEEESDTVVGVHDGYWFYTVGQRGGIKLPGGPWYVTSKDMTNNIVYVSCSYYETHKRRDAFVCGPFNWLAQPWSSSSSSSCDSSAASDDEQPQQQQQQYSLEDDPPLYVKVRHGPNMYRCQLQLGTREVIMAKMQSQTQKQQHVYNVQQQQGQQQQAQLEQEAASVLPWSSKQQLARGAFHWQQQAVYGYVELCDNDQGLAAGQYAVFYQDGVCLGSAQMLGCVVH
eukprot:gene7853-biopygen9702